MRGVVMKTILAAVIAGSSLLVATGANAQPAVAGYLWDDQTATFSAETIIVLTFDGARIEEITAFRSPELFPRFGLLEQLAT